MGQLSASVPSIGEDRVMEGWNSLDQKEFTGNTLGISFRMFMQKKYALCILNTNYHFYYLESTVSASSFGYIPYTPHPRSRADLNNQPTVDQGRSRVDQHHQPSSQLISKIKRHKSFFNSDALKEKKNVLLRRTESFHQDINNYR